MARPEVSPTAEALYEELAPLDTGDEEREWPLLLFCEALVGGTTEQIAGYVQEREVDGYGYAGWEILLDPEHAPANVLPWLGQFVGVSLEPVLTEAEQRLKIALPEGFRRGTPAAMLAAVKRTLTGGQTVLIAERTDGSTDGAWKLWVRTLASETPDEDATEAAVLSQKPIGIVVNYEAITGQSWTDLIADHATWNDVTADYASWDEAVAELP